MKKLLSMVLVFILLFTSGIPVLAADSPSPKEEVVYGLLNLDGSVENLHVVNIFNGGKITDFGNYSDIRNMTNSDKLSKNGEKITVNTEADKLYYQGTLEKKELPWHIDINYFLDGIKISGSELAGKSGKLKITMSVKENAEINSTFYDNYALQIALSLDNKLSYNIEAENATIAEAGSNKQLTYTVLPGNDMDITVTADVRDFEMEAITINGIKLSLGLEVDSDEFTGELSELTDAIKELDKGAAGLLEGLNKLASGMKKYTDGLKAFKDGLGELAKGADQLNSGAKALSNGLAELTKQNDSLVKGALAIQQATFNSVNAKLSEMGLGLPVLTPENYNEILSPIPDLAGVKKELDGVVQFTIGVQGYTEGVSEIGKGASDLAKGTAEFKASSSVVASSAKELYEAAVELNAGIKKLREGLAEYKDGTKKLRNGTSGMDSEIDAKVDEMLGSIAGKGGKVVSFVSDKNTKVSAVQFVLKTDEIKIPEAQEAVETKPVELSFWQKLLKLFGLYK